MGRALWIATEALLTDWTKPPPDGRVRIFIIHEDVGMGAGSLDFPDFVLLGDTREEIEAALPAALEAHCGRPTPYRIVRFKDPPTQ